MVPIAFRPLITLIMVGLPALVCYGEPITEKDLSAPISIAGNWRFATGDDTGRSAPDFDDSRWDSLQVPLDWNEQGYEGYSGYAWYRRTFRFDLESFREPQILGRLAVTLGKVQSAYELYAGGELIGSIGKLPPNPQIRYDQVKTFAIPPDAIDENGRLVIAMRVWRMPEYAYQWRSGPNQGPFLLGEHYQLVRKEMLRNFPSLLFVALFAGMGIYHLMVYERNRHLKEYFWFGLMTLSVGIYAFYTSQWKHLLDLPYLLLKKIEHTVIYLIPPLCLETFWQLMSLKIRRSWRFAQYFFVAGALVIALVPGLTVNMYALTIWQVAVLISIAFVGWQLVSNARRGNREARTVIISAVVFALTVINDILVDIGVLNTPQLVYYGFTLLIGYMALSFANHFNRMYRDLENLVDERTSELRQINDRLKDMASLDSLTGIYNRRGFTERAQYEIGRASRSKSVFSLILIDLDHFKQINDQYGHAAGDTVLTLLARLLQNAIRSQDTVARWGGEEFILLLPETEAASAALLAERLRDRVASHRFEYNGKHIPISMTCGIADYHQHMDLDTCINNADRALYQGKLAGRNHVIIYMDDESGYSWDEDTAVKS